MTVFHIAIVPPKKQTLLTGQRIHSAQGQVSANRTLALTGGRITSAQGSVAFAKSGLTLTGKTITSRQGTVTSSQAISAALTGQRASFSQGSVTAVKAVVKKFFPGHYVEPVFSANHSSATAANIQNQWGTALAADSRFAGVHAFYDWYHLEPITAGVYDYTLIDNDITWLNGHFPGKKIIIEVWTRNFSFGTSSQPTLPQSPTGQGTKVPDYIVSGAFAGSGGNPGSTWNSNGLLAAFWSTPVLNRLKALDAALAARYDGNQTVALICYDEFSPPGPSAGAPSLGYSLSLQQSAWRDFHATAASHWVNTDVICMANFPNDSSGAPDFGLFTYLQSIGVGVGGPDVLPPASGGGPGETYGEQILYGAGTVSGKNYGTVDYRGAMVISYEAENPQWAMTPTQIETYAYNTLQTNYMSWIYNPTNVDGTGTAGKGTTPWTTTGGITGVLNVLQANSFRVHLADPHIQAFFSQPNETAITGNSFVNDATGSGTRPIGLFFMGFWQKNIHTSDGNLIVSAQNFSSLTGFDPVSRSTAQLACQNLSTSTCMQMEGETVGAYINTADIDTSDDGTGNPVYTKMMIEPEFDFSSSIFPFNRAASVLTVVLDLQIPTCTGVTGTLPEIYAVFDLRFTDPNGVNLSLGAKIFRMGGSGGATGTGHDAATSYTLNMQLSDTTYMTLDPGSAGAQSTTWSGFKTFKWTVSYTQFLAGLNRLQTDFPSLVMSLDPTQWGLGRMHLNAEIQVDSVAQASSLGWSMRNLSISTA